MLMRNHPWRGGAGVMVAVAASVIAATAGTARAQQPDPEPRPATATPAEPIVFAAPSNARFLLIDRSLKAQPVSLLRIGGGVVAFTDEQRVDRDRPMSEVAVLAPASWAGSTTATAVPLPPSTPSSREQPNPELIPQQAGDHGLVIEPPTAPALTGVVELVDGQRLPGRPAAGQPSAAADSADTKQDQDILEWDHPRFGRLRLALDEVARILLDDPVATSSHGIEATVLGAAPPEPVDDEVVLRNGDRVKGLVERIGSEVEIGAPGGTGGAGAAGGNTTKAPLDRVQAITLANKRRAPAGQFAWLRDGTVVRVEALESSTASESGQAMTATLAANLGAASRTVQWAPTDMDALLIDGAAIRPLATLPVKQQTAAPGRRWLEPARAVGRPSAPLWVRDVQLRGPMTIEWELPRNATALSATLEMPPAAQAWGDCEVVVSLVTGSGAAAKATELAREHLNGERPRIDLNRPLPPTPGSARLRITVEEGDTGPIQDWVDIKRGLIAVGER